MIRHNLLDQPSRFDRAHNFRLCNHRLCAGERALARSLSHSIQFVSARCTSMPNLVIQLLCGRYLLQWFSQGFGFRSIEPGANYARRINSRNAVRICWANYTASSMRDTVKCTRTHARSHFECPTDKNDRWQQSNHNSKTEQTEKLCAPVDDRLISSRTAHWQTF